MKKVIVKAKKEKIVGFIKNPKFYIPASILIGVIIVGMASLILWKPGIARGEYSLSDIMNILSRHEKRIENLETKNTPATPSAQLQTTTTLTQPTQNNTPSSVNTNSTKTVGNSYAPSIETRTIIPFTDRYQLGSNTSYGHVELSGGVDGFNVTYTLDSYGKSPGNTYAPAVNRTIYVGDGGANQAIKYGQRMHTDDTYEQRYNLLLQGCDELLAVAKDKDSALQWCKNNIVSPNMTLFGF